MRNQVAAAVRMGVRAATINSDNRNDWTKVEAGIANGETDILLISPERLANEHFRTDVLASIAAHISMLVIDEAHCISDWGHDFRPHYRLLERIVKTLPPNLRLLATTATANDRVMEDLAAVLGPRLDISRGDLNRSSLSLQTIRLPSQARRLAWLAEQLVTLQGHGIIYALTVRDANQVAQWLQSRGFNVEAYTGETGERRELLEQALLDNQVKALVATTAPGMGYDKPDLAFVTHYQMPGSVVAYDQRNFLLDGRLVLVSPYDPSAGFNVGHAMQRNKLIYALADVALVVSSDLDKGGTWNGAAEQLDKLNFIPIHVRASGARSAGLEALGERGAFAWPDPQDTAALAAVFEQAASGLHQAAPAQSVQPEPEPAAEHSGPGLQAEPSPADTLFFAVRDAIQRLLTAPMKDAEIATALDVSNAQAKAWLQRLLDDGVIEKQNTPAGYIVKPGRLFE